jgi:hypothetical protein
MKRWNGRRAVLGKCLIQLYEQDAPTRKQIISIDDKVVVIGLATMPEIGKPFNDKTGPFC